jgi:hypothetical protein
MTIGDTHPFVPGNLFWRGTRNIPLSLARNNGEREEQPKTHPKGQIGRELNGEKARGTTVLGRGANRNGPLVDNLS